MVRTSIGEFIAALRKAKGLTQMDVANHLGVSNKTVSSWETGASCPDIALLPAIAELYGVTCDELLRGERIPLQEDEKVKETKREKVLAFQLARHKNTLFLATLIGYALASLGPILTFIISFGAARPPLGFFIGLLPLLAAVFMIFLFCYNASFWCTSTQEELEAEALKDFHEPSSVHAVAFASPVRQLSGLSSSISSIGAMISPDFSRTVSSSVPSLPRVLFCFP